MQAVGPVQRLRLSGIVKFGSVSTIGGATLAGFDLPTAQRLFGKPGKLDEIAVASKPNVATNQLLQQIREHPPCRHAGADRAGQAHEDSKDTNSFISFLQKFLLGFGGVALFVGSFVIANSLSITIAQRTRELATLRTLGASRRQLLRSIIIEALAIGILAAVIGLFAGLALAKGLFSLFDAVGFTLPNNGLTFETRTVVVSLAVGIIVTLLASLRPALRATRVPPIAAVREGATLPESRYARFRLPASILLTALGFGGLLWGLFAPRPRHGRHPPLHARRRAARVLRHRPPVGQARDSAGGSAWVAGDEDRRHSRGTCPRELAAEPPAHRIDCVCAHDRTRPGDARDDARGWDHLELQRAP